MTGCCNCCLDTKMPYAEEGSEKKKKKFWDIFRRRRKGSDTSSEDDDDAKKRGFLGRKKKDRGSKDVTNSFLINPIIRTDLKNSVESVRSNNSSELSGRRRIKAKVEASRELLAQESSSDEGSSYNSYTSSLQSGGSFPRRSRAARTERHNRRISKDLDGKVTKWTANIVYQESKDYDTKYRAKAKSATPSPAQSPKVQRSSSKVKCAVRSTSSDSIRAPPTPPPRREVVRPQSLADPPRYYPPVYTAPSHIIQARLRQTSQKSLSEQYLARLRMETSRSVSPRPPTRTESTSSISSESFGKKEEVRALSVLAERSEVSDLENRRPPHHPDRKLTRQGSIPNDTKEARKHSTNLEDALNELEAIYKKLSYDEKSYDSSCNGEVCPTDDMAYRRLNKREPSCQDVRDIMSQAGSYLLVSPTLSPPPIVCHLPPEGEPDVTYDDVVFRSVQHSNKSLKVLDPQPPFGIPLGPISPASNSDYLHARPTLITSGSTPDLVLDDLAFRNLRKDHTKKKAVRSLSANLSGLINRSHINNNNLNVVNNNLEDKSRSYSDIPEEMRLAQRVLDMRKNKKSQKKAPLTRQRSFSDRDTEYELLEQLAAETRATSDQIDRELRELSGADYTKSMTDLLQEMTKSLDSDFGCQTCTKENHRESFKYQPPWYHSRPSTRPGSIGPPRPRNPFKESPWGRKTEVRQDELLPSPVNGDRDSFVDDDVFFDNCDTTNCREMRPEDACRNIRDAASGLCRLEKEQGSAMLAVTYCMACCEQAAGIDPMTLLALLLAVACLFLFLVL